MVLEGYDYWVFDLDGTLVDAEWSYVRRTFDRVGDRLGREFSDREAELLWHGLGATRDARLRAWGVDPDTFWPAFHDVEDPRARAEATTLHEDAAALLERLDRRNVPVGVVTHCAEFLAEPVIDHLGIGDRFDAVLCCSEEVGWKPNPDPVEHVVAAMDASGRGIMVGDAASDVGAAWNAGLDAAHVERHGPDRRGHCVLADHRVRSLTELVDAGDGEGSPSPRTPSRTD